jgi:biopolymer transport protein ExbD
MNFRGNDRGRDDVEINLIPLIDVLLVILIFLAATTSFAHFTRLKITLPQAAAEQQESAPLQLAISQDGHYALNGDLIDGSTTADIARALARAAQGKSSPLLMINADAQATHQSVVNAMEAAKQAGIERLNFAAQTSQ